MAEFTGIGELDEMEQGLYYLMILIPLKTTRTTGLLADQTPSH